MAKETSGSSRRDFLLKTITLVPAVAIGGTGIGSLAAPAIVQAAEPKAPEKHTARDYNPTFLPLKNMPLSKPPSHV